MDRGALTQKRMSSTELEDQAVLTFDSKKNTYTNMIEAIIAYL